MIPLAQKLKAMNNNVFIASGEEHLSFFRKELPGFPFIHFPGFRMKYSRRIPQYIIILLRLPLLAFHIVREHFMVRRIIKEYSIDIIISDSRPGLWNSSVKSVLVFHFPRVPLPRKLRFLESTGIALTRFFINKYTLCFIPDMEGEPNLSGRLSHEFNLPENARYIGILSRFRPGEKERIPSSGNPYCTVILSGPEPQKELLKNKLTEILITKGKPCVILEGKPGVAFFRHQAGNITFISHLPSDEMKELIQKSEIIITRSGYTTIMELISLRKSALLIPTPGQTEQEYLARYLSETGWFKTCLQKNLGLTLDLNIPEAKWTSEIIDESGMLLEKALSELLEQ